MWKLRAAESIGPVSSIRIHGNQTCRRSGVIQRGPEGVCSERCRQLVMGSVSRLKDGGPSRTHVPGTADIFSAPGTTDIFSAPGTADIFSAPGTADILSAPGTADILSASGTTDILSALRVTGENPNAELPVQLVIRRRVALRRVRRRASRGLSPRG
ncbi:hypothetical protein [Candidatus Thiosymbion oneisti]|uniref:hypothetical protein n=1 Tax=Candidatus Thiosymbion oneisti TaxID=589554 RepID=UPI0013FE3B5D|nr:hypothetical protein [Candidatus Thiosymbion oneisti]